MSPFGAYYMNSQAFNFSTVICAKRFLQTNNHWRPYPPKYLILIVISQTLCTVCPLLPSNSTWILVKKRHQTDTEGVKVSDKSPITLAKTLVLFVLFIYKIPNLSLCSLFPAIFIAFKAVLCRSLLSNCIGIHQAPT